MIKILKFPAIELSQGSTKFYSSVINSDDLAKIATVIPRSKDPKKGIQRVLNKARVSSIAKFVKGEKKIVFPNSLIINLPKTAIYKDGYILVNNEINSAQIIDGQHRYEGILESGRNLPLIVTCFKGLTLFDQARIFLKINSTQKGINTSLVYDLFNLTRSGETVELIAIDLVYKLNDDEDSPWYDLIKTTDARAKKEAISSSSFISPLKKMLKNKGGVFASLDFNEQYIVLKNYFNAIKKMYPGQWANKDYVLTKGIGVNTFLRLMPTILIKCIKNQDVLCEKVGDVLKPLKDFEFTGSEYSGFSSESGYEKLATILEDALGL